MNIVELKNNLLSIHSSKNELVDIKLNESTDVKVYPKSINEKDNSIFFIGKEGLEKSLYIIEGTSNSSNKKFDGEKIGEGVKCCKLSSQNRRALQAEFDFLNPVTIGLKNSFGFGDRIGLANAGHIRSLDISDFAPVLTQQSIRELTRTNRTADKVMDAAVWAVFQEGYKSGFGADADHLKTTEDIDRMVKAGYKMFTFDPSEYVENEADEYGTEKLLESMEKLPWDELEFSFTEAEAKYLSGKIEISDRLSIAPTKDELLKAYSKYGNAIAHIKRLYNHIKNNYSNYDYEIEISVDETESVTTPFEHFFFASELNRLKIKFVSLAPRFIGDFEKGIDYKGDLNIFKQEYEKHLAITKYFGNYKISLHSGSDKFSVYKVIGSMKEAFTHVKTAGTSYLEALKVTAIKQPELFKEILDYAGSLYEEEKRTYHVSADINKLKPSSEYDDSDLEKLFDSDDIRQILHVTFGRILTDTDEKGSYIFKDKVLRCLEENEDTHYDILVKHFHKHLVPFNNN